ncbi:MAG: transcription termination/antitermination protein NusG, partial [Planctomycetaceae bacterium]
AWSACHVRPRCEKIVSQRLREDGSLGYFLPLSVQEKRYQRRRIDVQSLLFPGYVFVHGDHELIRLSQFRIPGVVKCLDEPNQKSLHKSLLALQALIECGAAITPEQRLEPGMAVEITGGPLAGRRGVVIENKKALRFLIQLDFIQQGVSVAVDASIVKAL